MEGLVGKIVEVNYLSSRVLLNDLIVEFQLLWDRIIFRQS